ncbi:MAG: type VII toxin-antitoxin system HepT family RNase toxin [Candidatus Jordarchaeum sp.]|uniref:type VII toxin-antitoxin system HepT family RNase toxin n=1 Tax=Candidatus Jordarchaeum sp. TaxID=2823881 RepID=UPI00404AB64D
MKERKESYLRKIQSIQENIKSVKEWLVETTLEKFLGDKKTRLAVFKAFQEVVETCMDLAAMLVRDRGVPPKDDYTNLETLREEKVISDKMEDILAEANGLRNWIIHRYNKLEEEEAYKAMLRLITPLEGFIGVVKKWI